ncbi:MAG: hypothetical protein LBV32_03150 [Tannerellaceae bacterium]|jgi:hypothetical protein|nr:hypothetical protein [Tannerellaceae bacterium]
MRKKFHRHGNIKTDKDKDMADVQYIPINQLPEATETQVATGMVIIALPQGAYRAPGSRMKGRDGDNVYLRNSGTYIQWSIGASGAWSNLVALSDIKGDNGKDPVFRKGATGIEFKLAGNPDTSYTVVASYDDLGIKFEDLTGDQISRLKLKFSDLTETDIEQLQQPALQAAADVTDTMQGISAEWTNTLKPGIETSVQDAQKATTKATAAVETASTAAGNADDAAGAANAATESAQTAINMANVATEGAQTAKNNADTATQNANAATDSANTAAQNANTAAAVSKELNEHPPVMQTNDSGILTWWVWNLDTHSYADTGLPARGAEGKPLKVSSDGYYMYWDETAQAYVTSDVEASVSVDLQNIPVNFTEAETKETIGTGDSVPTVFGKLKKWFSSFGALAWKSTVDYATEVDNTPAIPTKTSDITNDSDFQTGSNVDTKISAHNQNTDAHADIRERIEAVYNIATGARLGIVFDDTAQFNSWLAGIYEREDGITPADLKVGENIYLRALGEIDLWWDGVQAQQQESEKVDLSDYVTLTAGDAKYLPKADTAADSNKLGGIDSTLYGFMNGSKTVTTLASLALDKQIIYADISANVSLSVASRMVDGQPSHIFVRNTTATARIITIPTTGSYVSMSGASKTLPASGYQEISIAYDSVISKYRITVLEAE